MSSKIKIFSLVIGVFFCFNSVFSASTKTSDGYITDLNCWKDCNGFIVDFDKYIVPPTVASQITRKGKYIVPKTHPHFREMTSLLTTAAISNLEVALWISDDVQFEGMAVIEDVVVRTKK